MSKKYLYCNYCGFKKIIEDENDLSFVFSSAIQKTLPQLDENKKVINPIFTPQAKIYKCLQCGRGIVERKLIPPFEEAYKKLAIQQEKEKQEKDKKKREEDGKPLEKKFVFDEEKNNNS